MAFAHNCHITHVSNSGIVNGAKNSVGGVAGYLDNSSVHSSLNTNWIAGTALNSGAIVGFNDNNSRVDTCFFDNQMCILDGVGTNMGTVGFVVLGLPTVNMLGDNLQNFLRSVACFWNFQPNLYPVSDCEYTSNNFTRCGTDIPAKWGKSG